MNSGTLSFYISIIFKMQSDRGAMPRHCIYVEHAKNCNKLVQHPTSRVVLIAVVHYLQAKPVDTVDKFPIRVLMGVCCRDSYLIIISVILLRSVILAVS